MRTHFRFYFFFWLMGLALLSVKALPAMGASITFDFTGDVTLVEDPLGVFNGKVSVGDPFVGEYTFDSTAVDISPLPTVGDYFFTSPPNGIRVSVGGLTFQTDPTDVQFFMEMVNNHTGPVIDAYGVQSFKNVTQSLCPPVVDNIAWGLQDTTLTALSSEALLLTPPNLSAFQQNLFNISNNFQPSYLIRGIVRTISERGPGSTCNPCAAWDSHGEFVRCVVADVNARMSQDRPRGDRIIDVAGRSDIGKPGFIPPECQ